MKRAVFLVPREDNEGRPFPADVFGQLQAEILEQFPGYQMDEVQGYWKGPDEKIYFDRNLRVTLVIEEKEVEGLKAWLAKVRQAFKQEAIWLEVSDVEAHLI